MKQVFFAFALIISFFLIIIFFTANLYAENIPDKVKELEIEVANLKEGIQNLKLKKGIKGDRGQQGEQGIPGKPGLNGYIIVKKETTASLKAGYYARRQCKCPAGQNVVGGGGAAGTNFFVAGFHMSSSYPTSNSTWEAVWVNASTRDVELKSIVYAICVDKP